MGEPYSGPYLVLTREDAETLYPLIPVTPEYDVMREKFIRALGETWVQMLTPMK